MADPFEDGDDFLAAVANAAEEVEAMACTSYRSLGDDEIAALEAGGNVSEDWSLVYVRGPLRLTSVAHRIVRCFFHGRNLISSQLDGLAQPQPGVLQPEGLYDSTFRHCVLGPRVLVKRCDSLSHVVVREGATLTSCPLVACTGPTSFAVGSEVLVGSETVGRPVLIYPDITTDELIPQAKHKTPVGLVTRVGVYKAKALSHVTIIGPHARLSEARVLNSFIGPYAVVEGSKVDGCTLLSTRREPCVVNGGSLVSHSILQWGVMVAGHATVRHSLLMEHSAVRDTAMVQHTVLCPDSTICLGECHHSFLGPFVGFNHLCALVAVVWPDGRGNIAHGAKVGANHTGRLPDQEAAIGEGVFFGTGVVAKFPLNMVGSAYTLLATNVCLEPQRLHFPFSLVVSPRDPLPGMGGRNQILPAWVLAQSPYTVLRNEDKYQKRGRAQRMPQLTSIFRPHIVDLMIEARARLQTALCKRGSADPQCLYTERDVPGLGANYTTHKAIEEGVKAYTLWVRRYALHGLLHRLLGTHDIQEWRHQCPLLKSEFSSLFPCGQGFNMALSPPASLDIDEGPLEVEDGPSSDDSDGETSRGDDRSEVTDLTDSPDRSPLPRGIGSSEEGSEDETGSPYRSPLAQEVGSEDEGSASSSVSPCPSPLPGVGFGVVGGLLRELLGVEECVVALVEGCKARDDVRGHKVMEDYDVNHPPADKDPLILAMKGRAARVKGQVEALLPRVQGMGWGEVEEGARGTRRKRVQEEEGQGKRGVGGRRKQAAAF